MKLTDRQIAHLQALSDAPERGAYPGLHIGTLNALALKGFVAARRGLGSMAMPRTAIKWRLTEAGRAALTAGK